MSERLLAIADIVSALCMSRSYKEAYPKERYLDILRDMGRRGELDETIVSVMETSFDDIMSQADEAWEPTRQAYERIRAKYRSILKEHIYK